MFKQTEKSSVIKSDKTDEIIIISKGINPGNSAPRSMSSTSRLVSLLKPSASALKVDSRYYGNSSLEEMGLNPEPPVPVHTDAYKVVFSGSSPEQIIKDQEAGTEDCCIPCDEEEIRFQP